jgi:hypothetical protein
MALFVLQKPADIDKVRGLCSEICPASPHDAYPAVSIKAEVFSDAEEEKCRVPLTFVGVKGEPEVSCVSVPMLRRFHKHMYPSFYELLLQ